MTVPKRFGVLRFFATLLKVIAWIVLVLALLAAIGLVVASTTGAINGVAENAIPGINSGMLAMGGGILGGIGVLIIGLVYFLILYVGGETIHLYLAVEENTRLTAALLLRMHQDGQAEANPAYSAGGAFTNEPFES